MANYFYISLTVNLIIIFFIVTMESKLQPMYELLWALFCRYQHWNDALQSTSDLASKCPITFKHLVCVNVSKTQFFYLNKWFK